jgi:hypothetical protein
MNEVVDVLRLLDPRATIADLRHACRRLIGRSDLVASSLPTPFPDVDLDAISDAVYQFIVSPDDESIREIVFTTNYLLLGHAIEYYQFAHMYSEEFLLLSRLDDSDGASGRSERLLRLNEYFAAILFRFTWCARNELAFFPVSEIISFAHRCNELIIEKGNESDIPRIIHLTLLALKRAEIGRW